MVSQGVSLWSATVERVGLSAYETVCGCGTDHAALVNEVLSSQRESHPWDAEYHEWRKGRTNTCFRRRPIG